MMPKRWVDQDDMLAVVDAVIARYEERLDSTPSHEFANVWWQKLVTAYLIRMELERLYFREEE